MSSKDKEILLLNEIGLTKTQAKIYLILLRNGMAGARTLANMSESPRSLVYRTLDELQKIGLVEREINIPHEFRAIPPDTGLEILMSNKFQEYKKIEEKTKIFLRKIEAYSKKPVCPERFKLKMCEGRKRILQIIKRSLETTKQNLEVISTLERWLHVIYFCSENYGKMVARGVKCRVIVEKPEGGIICPDSTCKLCRIESWMTKPNFELRFTSPPLKTNAAIFDQNEAIISYFPSKPVAEAPVLWTNHPSFVAMTHDHFEKTWETAVEYTGKIQMTNINEKNVDHYISKIS